MRVRVPFPIPPNSVQLLSLYAKAVKRTIIPVYEVPFHVGARDGLIRKLYVDAIATDRDKARHQQISN
jgi:hypothetical protein